MSYSFDLLHYQNLDTTGLEQKIKKVSDYLTQGDFKAAEVKKMSMSGYYRAKLDNTNRLLFKPMRYQEKTYLLLLEVIRNHDYDKSRFLRGADIQDIHIHEPTDLVVQASDTLRFLPQELSEKRVHYLDRFIAFDEIQHTIFQYGLPLILIGSAGSGKTSLTLEKMKTMVGEMLYVTLSPYLTQNARQLYYANHYENDDQNLDFLSFEELIETIAIPTGKEISMPVFLRWHQQQKKKAALTDGRKLYEEFRGVLAGSEPDAPYLSREKYVELGIRQSIYASDEREEVYRLFKNYVAFLQEGHYFDTNILSYAYQEKVVPRYDVVVIDEVQDFTNSQLALVLALLKAPHQFFMCGDANQIVHPNFFSWSGLKQLFYTADNKHALDITRILTRNYRNTLQVTELANRILKIKNVRFGSIDKESHYLIESQSTHTGDVGCIQSTPETITDVNAKIRRSIDVAIIVLNDQLKEEARRLFDTPLVFSVQEAKGLEYEHVILYHFMDREQRFLEIAEGLGRDALSQDFKYARAKSKSDKSMEIYKFYINSLYVAITRAITSVYLIERDLAHPLIKLLDINAINQSMMMDVKESSLEEWQKEASRLAQQGKTEQADAINQVILKQHAPPWVVMDQSAYDQLCDHVLVQQKGAKQEQMTLLEVAMLYKDRYVIRALQDQGMKAAKLVKKSYPIMYEKHFSKYGLKKTQPVLKDVHMYGIDHRTVMNFTPLMCAMHTGNRDLVNELLTFRPALDVKDLRSRTALQIGIAQVVYGEKKHAALLAAVYSQLSLDSLSLDVDSHLVKIDASRAEYFLFQTVLALYVQILDNVHASRWEHGLTANHLFLMMQKIPNSVWPDFRKKQPYLSGLLSRNEVDSVYQPNRKLFKRVRRGYYVINPALKIKTSCGWEVPEQAAYIVDDE